MSFASGLDDHFHFHNGCPMIFPVVTLNWPKMRNRSLIIGTEKVVIENEVFANDGIVIGDDIFIDTDEIRFGKGIFKANKNLIIFTHQYSGDFCHTGTGKVKIFVNGFFTPLPNVEKEENAQIFLSQERLKNNERSLFDRSEFSPLNSSNIFKYLTTKPLKLTEPEINTQNITSDRIEIMLKSFVNNGMIQGREIKVKTETFDFGNGSFCVTGYLIIYTKNLKINPKRKHFKGSTGSVDIYVDGVHRYSLADLSKYPLKKK